MTVSTTTQEIVLLRGSSLLHADTRDTPPPPANRSLQCECGALILAQAAVAADREVPGLESALECVLSLDDRTACQLGAQARAGATERPS